MLGEHLQSFGVTVERGVELIALSQDGDAVHLTLRREDGSTEQVSASWVIGADGGHSVVRKMVGTKLAGSFVGDRHVGAAQVGNDRVPHRGAGGLVGIIGDVDQAGALR